MTRDGFLQAIDAQLGLPYLWDGKGYPGACGWNNHPGAPEPYDGRDCSGLVTSSMLDAGGPDLRGRNAQMLWDSFEHVAEPLPGTLCFYGASQDHVDHVMVYAGDDGDHAGQVVGACGGGHLTVTVGIATQQGARVQYRNSVHYRRDFLGFADPPFTG